MQKTMDIRFAEEKDVGLILAFIKELADYENLLAEVTATEKLLKKTLFEDKKAEVIIGEAAGEPVAFALFFSNFSTFLGKPGLYLEDLYVREGYRGYGFGKQLLSFLANLVIERDYGRLEWWCLDWNKPSIDFYKMMGAEPMDEWTVFRLTGKELQGMAAGDCG
ncbi:GNAT family N-acetyltransferase [Trichococcus alkaliphilus]|uniref:GNAT family N-acetyltransferase n=1 Tax=Trichococcus alkaliphilus TaxID=2052943 RepID=UPI001EFC6C0E|nr:GNAT family N-acetyltransferase [Trichococcus alkaliphilus]